MRIKVFLLIVSCIVLFIFLTRRKDMDIAPLKQYVQNYIPCKTELERTEMEKKTFYCYDIKTPPRKVRKILKYRKLDEEYKKLVLLAYLKLYYAQLNIYHQSFEIRNNPFKKSAFAKALCEITGTNYMKKKIGPEYLSGETAFSYIKANNLFKQDKDIQNLMKAIEKWGN